MDRNAILAELDRISDFASLVGATRVLIELPAEKFDRLVLEATRREDEWRREPPPDMRSDATYRGVVYLKATHPTQHFNARHPTQPPGSPSSAPGRP
jgi:hypothetical protein